MTPEALESFMSVISSLKSIALSFENQDLTFSIYEGSAGCAVDGTKEDIESIYCGIDTAIKGKSTDRKLTSNLKLIQQQFLRDGFKYNFVYERQGDVNIDLAYKLVNSKIFKKRVKKGYGFRIRVLQGFLNQIGGKDPNYHFDYGHGVKKTISCEMKHVPEIIKYLYHDINVLVISKEIGNQEVGEYHHLAILDVELLPIVKHFFQDYYNEANFVNRLEKIHDFINSQIEKSALGYSILKTLLICFNDKNLHLSEIKTLLIISKFYLNNEEIIEARNALYETYQIIKSDRNNV